MKRNVNHESGASELRVLPWDCAGCGSGAVRTRALERRLGHLLHVVGMGRMVWGGLASLDKPSFPPRSERDARTTSKVIAQRYVVRYVGFVDY
jgi:hypothetical protein